MHFVLERSEFAAAVARVFTADAGRTIPGGNLLRITTRKGSVELAAVGVDGGAVTIVEVETQAESVFCVPGRRLQDALERMPNTKLSCSLHDRVLRLSAGKLKLEIGGPDVGDFPRLPRMPDSEVSIPFDVLRRLLRRTAYAAHGDFEHPALAGVNILREGSRLRAIATDRQRIARAYESCSDCELGELFINIRSVHRILGVNLGRADRVVVAEDDRHLFFGFTGTTLFASKLETSFPGAEKAIPQVLDHRARVGKQELLEALDLAILVDSWRADDDVAIRLEIGASRISVSARDGEQGMVVAPLKAYTQGSRAEIVLSGEHLKQALRVLETNDVEIGLAVQDGTRAVVRSPESDDCLAMLVGRA